MKKVLHILSAGDTGGIEALCSDYADFSKHENIFLFLWGGGYNAEKIREMGKKVYILNASKKHIFALCRKAENICVKEKVDVVITHHSDIYAHICMMLLKQSNLNIKTIAYAHANAIDMFHADKMFQRVMKKKILKWSLSKSDRVIAVSESVKESVVNIFKTPRNHVTVVYNGVNIDRFGCKTKFKEKCIQIIYVGRLVEEKRVQITLQALSMLSDELDYKFVIVGTGAYKDELDTLSKKLGIADRVIFAGERHDIEDLLRQSDIFIHVPLQEGFGITVVEAMASGLTCICSKVGGIPEIIQDGENGYLVSVDAPEELAMIIKDVALNYENEKNLLIREKAKKRAEDFSVLSYVADVDDFIQNNVFLGGG